MDDLFLKSATLNGAQELLNEANIALSSPQTSKIKVFGVN